MSLLEFEFSLGLLIDERDNLTYPFNTVIFFNTRKHSHMKSSIFNYTFQHRLPLKHTIYIQNYMNATFHFVVLDLSLQIKM